jgi:hypothetical protein
MAALGFEANAKVLELGEDILSVRPRGSCDQNMKNVTLRVLRVAAWALHSTVHDVPVGGLCSRFLFRHRRAENPGGSAPQLQRNNGPRL